MAGSSLEEKTLEPVYTVVDILDSHRSVRLKNANSGGDFVVQGTVGHAHVVLGLQVHPEAHGYSIIYSLARLPDKGLNPI
ncbi:MAG: hypothetical protein JSR53_17910 [Proteobacteria bacterium]|nr:hypothetical protein [Pseudomonadota bacterium]